MSDDISYQCWICPYCHDDHSQSYECTAKQLTAERDELKQLLTAINSRVCPGETDSLDSLKVMYRERDAASAQLVLADALAEAADCGIPREELRDALAAYRAAREGK